MAFRVSLELRSPLSKITLVLGGNLEGNLREVDISDANSCPLLVGGTTGGGKSGVIRVMLYSLFWRYSPALAKVLLISITGNTHQQAVRNSHGTDCPESLHRHPPYRGHPKT